jgi:hypothetical protein
MADDARTNSGSIPDPIPEVRDEGPGGTDLTSSSDDADGGETEASRDGAPGHLPHPVRDGTTEGPHSGE